MSKGDFFVPLLAANADEKFLLELRYTVPKEAFPRAAAGWICRSFPKRRPCRRSTCASICRPRKPCWALSGRWSEEFHWRLSPSLKWEPSLGGRRRERPDLLGPRGDCRGRQSRGRGRSCPTASFTSSRRFAPPRRPTARSAHDFDERNWLSAIVFIIVVLGGLLLLPAGLGGRARPSAPGSSPWCWRASSARRFSMQLLNGVLAAALVVVLVLWSVAYLASRRPGKSACSQPAPEPDVGSGDGRRPRR